MTGNENTFIIAIDQSTSATKGILFSKKATIEHKISLEHKQYYPRQDFVEHDPEEIFQNTIRIIKNIFREKNISPSDIATIAITNQRETAMIWDRHTGQPVYNAVVWQCQRGAGLCARLRDEGYGEMIMNKTGLIIDPYFSASKLSWIIENVEGAKSRMKRGDLLLGTMDSWLLWRLAGGKIHATDYSNACRTMLFNIHKLEWDQELVELFGLNISMFPEVHFSDEVFGQTDPAVTPGKPVNISGLLGDSHAALFGQRCFIPGMAKATYGTGSSIMMNIGRKPLSAPNGLVTSIGWGRDKCIDYVFEGNIHCTGDTISWLVKDAGLINNASESEQIALSVPDNNGVYFVPAFVGLGAPYWDNRARACLSGMGRNTTRAHIVRAALESIAYQIKDLIDLMIEKGGIELKELKVDGGATRNDFLMQFQADMIGKDVIRSDIAEISALGSTFMAGLATGFWNGMDEIKSLHLADRTFSPKQKKETINRLYEGWKMAVKRAQLY
ncbi:MAG: glycerol kinase [Bacteroidetes bacterium RBG_13_43_22]|nr:MAG: glycerol kinase [Bacteroidetes bacterium RBG_13_43_22]